MIAGIIFISILIVIFIYTCVVSYHNSKYNADLKNNGIETMATISSCSKERISPSSLFSNWYSFCSYYVNGKEYGFGIQAIIPVGTKFKVRYAPTNPRCVELVNPHEFDNYPRKPQKK